MIGNPNTHDAKHSYFIKIPVTEILIVMYIKINRIQESLVGIALENRGQETSSMHKECKVTVLQKKIKTLQGGYNVIHITLFSQAV